MTRKHAKPVALALAAGVLMGCGGEPPPTESFTEVDADFEGIFSGALAWGDYDEDGDLDLVVDGMGHGTVGYVGKLYGNAGQGSFVETSVTIQGVSGCSLRWGDCEGDGDLDLLVAGLYIDLPDVLDIHALYLNDGGDLTRVDLGLSDKRFTAWGDYDNDGDLDLTCTSYGGLAFYQNDGAGSFAPDALSLPESFSQGISFAWGDYDNDGDLDLAFLGVNQVLDLVYPAARIFRNDGGSFADSGASLEQITGALAWGDYDCDGDLDLAMVGIDGLTGRYSLLYRNEGGDVFSEETNAVLEPILGQVAWADYDNDGDPDLAMAGYTEVGDDTVNVTKVYRNDGGGVFAALDADLTQCTNSCVAWGDCDGDGDLDLAVAGIPSDSSYPVTKLYRNEVQTANTPPTAPTGLSEDVPGAGPCEVTFSWSAATDAETRQESLTYNLRVWTDDGSTVHEVMPSHADPVTGWRRVAAMGNVQHNTSWRLMLPSGDHYWSVQAVDSGFMGSPWAAERTVTVP